MNTCLEYLRGIVIGLLVLPLFAALLFLLPAVVLITFPLLSLWCLGDTAEKIYRLWITSKDTK